jgi:quinolinate synthase
MQKIQTDQNLKPFSALLAAQYSLLRARTASFLSDEEWAIKLPYIDAIERLKRTNDIVILAHNYQSPEIFHTVADVVGDSLALAQKANTVEAQTIIMCGVHFMAETAKMMNMDKTVLLPDLRAGCSLAESITAADVRLLKQKYPGVPVVTYVNTSADVKAETDICCTSANAVHVVNSLASDTVIFLPDLYLGKYVASQTKKKLILWQGACEVHERFTGKQVATFRAPGTQIIAHPECPPDVLAEADFVGSTAAMQRFVEEKRPKRVVMITECSMSANLAAQFPEVEFTQPCNLCPHMQRISLEKVYLAIIHRQYEIRLDPTVARRASSAVAKMLEVGRREAA